MNKTEALARLQALENETAALRKIIEAPEVANSLLTKPEPGSGEKYWGVGETLGIGLLGCVESNANTSNSSAYDKGANFFQSSKLATAYAEAIETMLLLRHQPGTVIAKAVERQFYIGVNLYESGICICEVVGKSIAMIISISPMFDSNASAQAAINTIGADRILRMFKTFHHIE